MKEVITVEGMKKSDRQAMLNGISGRQLMYRAANGVFQALDNWLGRIAIIVGGGNNGGDGYALAVILKKHNFSCDIYKLSNKLTEDGQYYQKLAYDAGAKIYDFDDTVSLTTYDIVVDSIFGTGFQGTPRARAKSAIGEINKARFIVSVDINSGLNGTNGKAVYAVKSDLTVSIATYKPGHFLNDAKDFIRELKNVDIGIELAEKPYFLMESIDFKRIFPKRKYNSHKGMYGKTAIVGGCVMYSGAVKLAAMAQASLCAGCGLTTLIVPQSIIKGIHCHIVESTCFPMPDKSGYMIYDKDKLNESLSDAKSIAIGMGWGKGSDNKSILEYIIKRFNVPIVIDADGLNTLAKLDLQIIKNQKIVITPHIKEFSRLTGIPMHDILMNPIKYAKKFALEYNIVVLLKGTTTIITDGREVYLSNTGTPAMSKGGSGDVLSGVIASLNAFSTESMLLNAAAGAYICGRAAEYADMQKNEYSILATDTIANIYKAITEIITQED